MTTYFKYIVASIGLICFFHLSSATLFASSVVINGGGATLPTILFERMFAQYQQEYDVTINYRPIGSIGGIEQLLEKRVNFAATDITYRDDSFSNSDFVYIPVTIGAVAVVYHLPGFENLLLSPDVLVGIFSGKITKWNDHRIHLLNPNVSLPNIDISVIHRGDPSGTTFMFTSYLSKASTSWRRQFGAGPTIDWALGAPYNGNNSIASAVSNTLGSISYVEWHFALKYDLKVAAIQNRSLDYVLPTFDGILETAEENQNRTASDGLIYSRSPGYPICGISWLMLHKNQYTLHSKEVAKTLIHLASWMTTVGQIETVTIEGESMQDEFIPLPDWAIRLALQRLKTVRIHPVNKD